MEVQNLTKFEQEEILRFLLYVMEQDTRARLMLNYPIQYNKLAEEELLVVKRSAELVPEGSRVSSLGKAYEAGETIPEYKIS